jgi:hypothetical protein
MHRYQVAKYVIFDTEKIFVKKFPNILASKENFTKIKKFKNAVVEKIVFVFRAKDDCFVGAFE